MADKGFSGVLNANILKGLSDKLYDKRKNAALEVEKLVRGLVAAKDDGKILAVLATLRKEFVFSTNANARKGGVIGIAATGIALGQLASQGSHSNMQVYLGELVPPILSCFTDTDARVRYYACEALYNITKVARGDILLFFNRIFDGLAKLAADPDPSVKTGSELLDRLMKDIVTECQTVDVDNFIPLLSERIYAVNPHVRQFLVSWLTVLDSVPEIGLLRYLPNFLNGLFKILSDPAPEIRRLCENVMGEFLREIHDAPSAVNVAALVGVLVAYSCSDDPLAKLTAVAWIGDFVLLAGPQMLPFTADIVAALLPSLSAADERLRERAQAANTQLSRLVVAADPRCLEAPAAITLEPPLHTRPAERSDFFEALPAVPAFIGPHLPTQEFDLAAVLEALTQQLSHPNEATRQASLHWLVMLRAKVPYKIYDHLAVFAPALLHALADPDDRVVLLALEMLAALSSCPAAAAAADVVDTTPPATTTSPEASAFFSRLVVDLVALFRADRALLDTRGTLIVRQLCVLLRPELIFGALAAELLHESDLEFARLLVQTLHLILLTATELHDLRTDLKQLATPAAVAIFDALYRSWCHAPVAVLALCLLCQVYDHACALLAQVAELEVTVAFLTEVDKLVQLLESPVFTHLRLQLLEPQRHAHLVKALYGLLMLLPQCRAYTTLKARLDCIPTIIHALVLLEDPAEVRSQKGNLKLGERHQLNESALLAHFMAMQARHAEARRQQLRAKPQ